MTLSIIACVCVLAFMLNCLYDLWYSAEYADLWRVEKLVYTVVFSAIAVLAIVGTAVLWSLSRAT